jgi:hypothetical protein
MVMPWEMDWAGPTAPVQQPSQKPWEMDWGQQANKPAADWRDQEAQETLKALQPQDPGDTEIRGNILPLSRNVESGKLSAAVPNFIYDPATLPGDVYTGKTDPSKATGRALGFAAMATPMARGALPKAAIPANPTPKAVPKMIESAEIKDLAQQVYKQAEDAGLSIKSDSYKALVSELVPKLKKEGFDPDLTPSTAAAMRRLISEIPKQPAPDAMSRVTGVMPKPVNKTFKLEDIDTLRQVVGGARGGVDKKFANDRRLAGIVSDRIDDWLDNLGPKDVASGDPRGAVYAIKQARGLWKRYRKAELLDEITENVKDTVGANYTSAGWQTAMRQQLKAIRKNPAKFNKFEPQEQAIIKRIIRGVSGENALRWAGKFAPSSPLISLLTGHTLGGPAGLVVMGAGTAAKHLSARMGQKKFDELNALVRRGYTDEGASY